MMITRIALAVASFVFVLGLALTTMAAREIITGTVEKVDIMKGHVAVKTQAGLREFDLRTPEKLKDVKVGDKITITVQEDGTAVIEEKR
ncbi:MAG: copper-binding protein [Acidobacteria bacterium]|nr:copper-binding protein [Acidobacteriota bacterium]